MNQSSYNFKNANIKGSVGEEIIDTMFLEKGWMGYSPIVNNESHPIDRIYINQKTLEQRYVDVKTKELRINYPDTGYPLSVHKKYMILNRTIPVVILWVDYLKGEIYGNFISNLVKPYEIKKWEINGKYKDLIYPIVDRNDNIIYFPYDLFKVYRKLSSEEIKLVETESKNTTKTSELRT
jgi:hypothetical protein